MSLHSSQLGRGGRDDRRRRLLAEDPTAGAADASNTADSGRSSRPIKHKSENYGDADFLENQLRHSDLVPRRLVPLFLLFKAGIAIIAGLITLYIFAPRLLHTPNARPAAAVLGGPGSLSNWFASLLLLAAGFLAAVNYSVRRHKVDDYRGRYRVWFWAAFCWFLMATDVAASLHQAFQQTMISLAQTRLLGDGTIWWLAPAIVLVGATGIWLMIDMRSCRLATTALVLAAIAYAAALASFEHLVRMPSELAEVLILQGSLLAGHLLLCWSMALHARFVLLDAEGRLPRRAAAKPRRQRIDRAKSKAPADAAKSGTAGVSRTANKDSASGDDSGDAWVAVDPPHGGAQSVLKRANPPAPHSSPLGQRVGAIVSQASSSDSAPDESRLSKAERKALKKKQLDERLKAEQRKAANW